MRRLILIALSFLFLSSCFYRPVFVEGRPVGTGVGTARPQPPATTVGRNRTQVCHEISRKRCDLENCKEAKRDYVTLRCSGGDINRCEVSRNACE